MIEEKLQNAANHLPDPRGDFLSVEEKVKQKRYRPRATPKRRFAIVMVLCILLVGCVAVSEPDYHLYNGNWWQFLPGAFDLAEILNLEIEQTDTAAEKLGITLPETLGGNPVVDFNRYNLTNQKTLIQLAWLFPRYVYYSSYYGVEMAEPYITEDGREGTRHWREGADLIYGSTEDEIWRRQFSFDENDAFTFRNSDETWLTPGEITSFVHEGITVYVGDVTLDTLDLPLWKVTWVDEENNVAFCVQGEFETPDTLIGYAKEIIDLNKD